MTERRSTRRYAVVLCILTILFTLRVLGQVLAAFFGVAFLPPMDQWYSGLMPYSMLLPVQILLIAVMGAIVRDFAQGAGPFVAPRPRAGSVLTWLSYAYAGSMVLRYVLTMAWYPERRWFGGTIPIWFHLVLAAFLYTVSRYHLAEGGVVPVGDRS